MTQNPTYAASLLGALVADAAALGLHWIYDEARVADVATRLGSAAFAPMDPANFEGVPSYFAHGARRNGDLSQYGTTLLTAIQHLAVGEVDATRYQSDFAKVFGVGGQYNGYIDHATKEALSNISAGHLTPSGGSDDQLPALSAMPATAPLGKSAWRTIQSVTHVTPIAQVSGQVFADLLTKTQVGTPLAEALRTSAEVADDALRPLLLAALDSDETDSTVYGGITGRACTLTHALPLAFHIMAHADGYEDAVLRNILAGGDSCGRAIVIGAVMASTEGLEAIPLDWILSLNNARDIWDACKKVAAA